MLNRLGIKSILIFTLVFGTLGGVSIIGALGYYTGARALDAAMFEHLSSVRATKAQQLEAYFKGLRNQVETLANNPTIVEALSSFHEGFLQIPDEPLQASSQQALNDYYNTELIPKLAADSGAPTAVHYLPDQAAGRYLQYQYTVSNPEPVGSKRIMDSTGDGSAYDNTHLRFHSILRQLVEKFAYYDLFLIDREGNVVYSVSKETDFATNLKTGPYSETRLAEVFRAAFSSPHPGVVRMVDFSHYEPSYGQPAAFIASPVFSGHRAIGVLAFQLSVDEINRIMTGDGGWKEQGLGDTGETFLVGADNRMRSISRFLKEDKDQYLAAMRSSNLTAEIIDDISRLGTSILLQPVPADELSGKARSHRIVKDYRGVRVLSSWQPLHIKGVNWRILSEIDLAEARAPIREFGSRILIISSMIVVFITLIAMALAALFVRPISALIAGARQIASGKTNIMIDVGKQPEFADLARSFNSMVSSLRGETERAEQENMQQEEVMLRILPRAVARRLRQGDTEIAEGYENVTVLCAEIIGLAGLSISKSAEELIELTNDLLADIEDITEKCGVEKFKTQSNTFVAVSGFSAPRLDHSRCAVDFGVKLFGIVSRFNRARRTQLSLRIGVDSGPVVACVVGVRRISYDLLGDTVSVADRLRSQAEPGVILLTPEVRDRLGEYQDLEPGSDVILESGESTATSLLRPNAYAGQGPTDA